MDMLEEASAQSRHLLLPLLEELAVPFDLQLGLVERVVLVLEVIPHLCGIVRPRSALFGICAYGFTVQGVSVVFAFSGDVIQLGDIRPIGI